MRDSLKRKKLMKRTPMKRSQPRRNWTDAEMNPGYCQCGCGIYVGFWKRTDRKQGQIKGEPKRFANGHNRRANVTITPESFRAEWKRERPDVPYGFCWCGCGGQTSPSKATDEARRLIKGEPYRYVAGHRGGLRGIAEIIEVDGGRCARIELTQGYSAIVSEEDAEHIARFNWFYFDGYARRTDRSSGSPAGILMHRVILDVPDYLEVDHANGDGLDNRRCNIRTASRAQNQANVSKWTGKFSSGFKGVHWHIRRERWAATIGGGVTRDHLGYFFTEEEAALAYDKAAMSKYGEFARLNFPHAVEAAGGIALANERLSGGSS